MINTLTQETSLYEILIRVLPDGTWAAQTQTLTKISAPDMDDIVRLGDVTPLNREDKAAMSVLSDLMNDAASATLNLAIALRAELEFSQNLLAEARQELAVLKGEAVAND